jgi:hypothetical protein
VLAGKLAISYGCLSGQFSIYQTYSLSTAAAQFALEKLTSAKIQIALSM